MTQIMESNAFSDPEIRNKLKITAIEKDTPVYIEIYRRIRKLIKENVLQYGEQLPGELELASILGVGRTSLRTALTILYEDGYIKTLRGKGSYVSYDGRKEKFRRKSPVGIVFPPERISLLGELSRGKVKLKTIEGDEFLEEKLSPGENQIRMFLCMYCMNGEQAILSTYYYCSDLFEETDEADSKAIEDKIISSLQKLTVAAECEVIPASKDMVKQLDMGSKFKGDNHILVSTTYLDEMNHVIAYCKDYYNADVIRFGTTLKK